jgi:hypothetical protein
MPSKYINSCYSIKYYEGQISIRSQYLAIRLTYSRKENIKYDIYMVSPQAF